MISGYDATRHDIDTILSCNNESLKLIINCFFYKSHTEKKISMQSCAILAPTNGGDQTLWLYI